MIRSYCGQQYEVPIEEGKDVCHTTLGWGKVTYISPYPETMLAVQVHFKGTRKFVRFTITGKEYVTQMTPVIDFGAKLIPTPKSKGKVAEIMEDLEFLKEQKPELGIGPITYNGGDRTFTIKLI